MPSFGVEPVLDSAVDLPPGGRPTAHDGACDDVPNGQNGLDAGVEAGPVLERPLGLTDVALEELKHLEALGLRGLGFRVFYL